MFRNLLILVAVFGLGWGASFGAGAAYGRRSIPRVQAAAVPGGQFSQGVQGAGGGVQGRIGAVGTVDHLDGKTLFVAEANGQQVKVNLTDQTQILKETAGTTADLTSGIRVAVQPQGQPAADGTVTAATVQIVPEGVGQNGQGGQRGQGQGGQGGGGQRAQGNQAQQSGR